VIERGLQHGICAGGVIRKCVGNGDVRLAEATLIIRCRCLVILARIDDRQGRIRRDEDIRFAVVIGPIGCCLADKTGGRALLQCGHQHDGGRVGAPAGEHHQASVPIEGIALCQGMHEPFI